MKREKQDSFTEVIDELKRVRETIESTASETQKSSNQQPKLTGALSMKDIFTDTKGDVSAEFENLQKTLLSSLQSSFSSLNVEFDKVNIHDIIGKNEKDPYMGLFSKFGALRSNLLNQISTNLPTNFEFDNVSIHDIIGKNEKDPYMGLFSKFGALRSRLLNAIASNLPTNFEFNDNDISIHDIIGKNEKGPYMGLFSKFRGLRAKLIDNIASSLPENFSFDKIGISDILGETPEAGMFFRMRFAKLRHDLLGILSDNIKSAEAVDTQQITSSTQNIEPVSKREEASSESSQLKKIVKEGFEETHSLLKQIANFLKGDELTEREEAKKERMKYERLFGEKPDGTDIQNQEQAGSGKLGGGILAGLGASAGKGIFAAFSGIAAGLRMLSNPRLLIGVTTLAALGGALAVHAWAFKQFADDINWKNVFIGIGAVTALGAVAAGLGLVTKFILFGALGIAALGFALQPFTDAMEGFANLQWRDVFIGLGALAAFGAVAAILGLASPLIIVAAGAMGALSLVLPAFANAIESFIPVFKGFAQGFKTAGEAIALIATGVGDAIATVTDSIFSGVSRVFQSVGRIFDAISGLVSNISTSISDLASIGGEKLRDTAGGISAIGSAIAGFGGKTGLGALLSFFSKDPVKKFERFGELGSSLMITASAINMLNAAIQLFNDTGVDKFTSTMDSISKGIQKLEPARGRNAFDPIKALERVGKILPSFRFNQSFIEGSKHLTKLFEQISENTHFITTIQSMTGSIKELVASLDSIPQKKLELLVQTHREDTLITQPHGITADHLMATHVENEMLSSAQSSNDLATTFAAVTNHGPANTNVSKVNYNMANHIDATMQNVIYLNRF